MNFSRLRRLRNVEATSNGNTAGKAAKLVCEPSDSAFIKPEWQGTNKSYFVASSAIKLSLLCGDMTMNLHKRQVLVVVGNQTVSNPAS